MNIEITKDTVKRLKRMSKLLEVGWIKYQYEVNGKFCLIGAKMHVASEAVDSFPMLLVLHLALPRGYNSLVGFNDARKTKHEDIMMLMETAIGYAKSHIGERLD